MFNVKNGVLSFNGKAAETSASANHGGKFASPPKIVVIHFTAGGSARSSANWFSDPRNKSSSAHIVVERDGSVIQCVSFDEIAWHAGKSTWGTLNWLNLYSIGIELANWGMLRGSGAAWVNGAGQTVVDSFLGVHRNGNPDGSHIPVGWEAFPQNQLDAAVELVIALRAVYPITEIVGHDDIAPVRKSDPGPAFDMTRFRSRAFGDRKDAAGNMYTVNTPSGLNLRSGPGLDYRTIQLLPDKTLVEPIGRSGNWLEVSVLDTDGQASITGWVHSHYLRTE